MFHGLNSRTDSFNAVASSVAFGSVSGFFSTLLLQPFDRLKTLSQQEVINRTGIFGQAKDVVVTYGVRDLWRGLAPSFLRIVPGVALYFGFFELGKTCLPLNHNVHATNFFLGAASRTLAATLLMPVTVIKTRFESSYYRDKTVIAAARNIVKYDGLKGLFKGSVPTLLRDAPFSGLYLVFYRRHLQLLHTTDAQFAPLMRFTSGVFAGILACIVTQPFDILKTHMQLFPNRYRSLAHVSTHILQTGGFLALFNGFWLRAIRRTVMASLNWTLFDELFGMLHHHRH